MKTLDFLVICTLNQACVMNNFFAIAVKHDKHAHAFEPAEDSGILKWSNYG